VELAAAILIVNGALSAITSLEVVSRLADQGTASAPIALLSFVIGIGSVVLGILVRYGAAWLVAVNVVAVAGFLEVSSGTALGLLFGILDVVVLLALFRERPWFTWSPESGPERQDGDEA
jgi:hypothetical protein